MVVLKLFWATPGWMVAPGVWVTPAAGVVAVVGAPKRPPAGVEVVGVLTPVTGVEGAAVGLLKRPPIPETAGVSAGLVAVGLPKRVPAGRAAEGVGAVPKRDWAVEVLGAAVAAGV